MVLQGGHVFDPPCLDVLIGRPPYSPVYDSYAVMWSVYGVLLAVLSSLSVLAVVYPSRMLSCTKLLGERMKALVLI